MGLDSSSMLGDLPGMHEMLGPGPSTTNWLEQTEDKRVKMEWNGVRFCYFAINCIKSEEFKSYCLFWNFAFNSTELELTVVC